MRTPPARLHRLDINDQETEKTEGSPSTLRRDGLLLASQFTYVIRIPRLREEKNVEPHRPEGFGFRESWALADLLLICFLRER